MLKTLENTKNSDESLVKFAALNKIQLILFKNKFK